MIAISIYWNGNSFILVLNISMIKFTLPRLVVLCIGSYSSLIGCLLLIHDFFCPILVCTEVSLVLFFCIFVLFSCS